MRLAWVFVLWVACSKEEEGEEASPSDSADSALLVETSVESTEPTEETTPTEVSTSGLTAEAEDRLSAILRLSGSPQQGKGLYQNNCGGCHGVDARGGGVGPSLESGVSQGREFVVTTMLQGGQIMPSFAFTLSNDEFADLTSWLGQAF